MNSLRALLVHSEESKVPLQIFTVSNKDRPKYIEQITVDLQMGLRCFFS